MSTNNILRQALEYKELGWSVIPVKMIRDGEDWTKKPVGKWKQYQSTLADEKTIKKWFSDTPDICVGIVTGSVSNLYVVDTDTPEAEGRLEVIKLPDTPTVVTGRGKHRYFTLPAQELRNTAGRIPGLDSRGEGGFVVAPPSRHYNGKYYKWLTDPHDVPPAQLPTDLLELLSTSTNAPGESGDSGSSGSISRILKEGSPEGRRNTDAAKRAGHYVALGLSATEVEIILAGWARRCSPEFPLDELRKVIASIVCAEERKGKNGRSESAVAHIVRLARDNMDLFVDQYGQPHAEGTSGGALPLNRQQLDTQLARLFWNDTGKPAGSDAVSQAKLTLGALADDKHVALAVRVAQPSDTQIIVDLCNDDGAIEINARSWHVIKLPHATFRRFKSQVPLPTPDPNGTPADLMKVLQLLRIGENDRLLLACWMVTALFPRIPHAILAAHGPKGAAKSTLARLVRDLIDPAGDSLLSAPHDQKAFAITAEKRWVLAYDNLSHAPGWLSDTLCQASTGGTVAVRELYTNADEVLFDLQRVVVLTSVGQLADREDLLDRLFLLRMEPISDQERMTEREWNNRVAPLLPKALGGLYSVAAHVLAAMQTNAQRPAQLPRLADWAQIGALAAKSFGYTQDDFLTAWDVVCQRQASAAAEASPLPTVVEQFMIQQGCEWSGMSSELHALLTKEAMLMVPPINTRQASWPNDTNWLSRRLDQEQTALAGCGISVSRKETKRGSVITLRYTPSNPQDTD